jgi:D-alanyl-D-alanine dipeptidase
MSRDLDGLKHQPIPSCAEAQARKRGFRQDVRIDFAGALASEPCMEAKDAGIAGVNYYNSPFNPPYGHVVPGSIPELYLRRSMTAKLKQVNARLAPIGVELYLFDAWRPQAVQRYFHDRWFPEWLQARRPDLNGQALVDEVEKYWSAPTAGETSPSPHSTGGAADLTLVFSETRQPLFTGGMFDDVTESAWTDWFENAEPKSMSDEEARANRRLLYWTMSEAGFANNPTEWWHYSWGDQMWARLANQPAAHYGACNPTGRPDR